LERLATAHCASRCATASAAAFSAAVMWHDLVLVDMTEGDDGGRSHQPHGVRRDVRRCLARPVTCVASLALAHCLLKNSVPQWGAEIFSCRAVAARCRRGRGMGDQDGLRADADAC
jgi:hypothetical protein